MSSKNKLLLGKIETTPGTPVALAAATDAIRLITGTFTPGADPREATGIKQTFGNLPHGIIKTMLQLDVEFYIRNGGGLGITPDFAPIMHAANHTVTTNAGVSVLIDPFTGIGATRHTSSFEWYEDGLKWSFNGAMVGGLKIDPPLDGWCKCSASIFAPWADPVAAASLPAGIVYQVSDRIAVDTTDIITDAGTAIAVGSFAFDTSGAVDVRRLIGNAQAQMTDRPKPNVSFSKASLATVSDYTRLLALTDGAFSAVFGAAGNRATLSSARARYESVKPADDGVRINRDQVVAFYETNGDDAYQIKLD